MLSWDSHGLWWLRQTFALRLAILNNANLKKACEILFLQLDGSQELTSCNCTHRIFSDASAHDMVIMPVLRVKVNRISVMELLIDRKYRGYWAKFLFHLFYKIINHSITYCTLSTLPTQKFKMVTNYPLPDASDLRRPAQIWSYMRIYVQI